MADSVAYQHTDGNRNHDGSYELHGIKKVGTDRGHKEPDQWGLGSYFFISKRETGTCPRVRFTFNLVLEPDNLV